MVKILFTLLISLNLYAIEGTITVLEAPIFEKPDEKSKVIQYYRKGSSIFIHDAEASIDPYLNETFRFNPENYQPKNNDEFLTDAEIYIPEPDSPFYKTISRAGREAYILKEHVFIEYKDRRELDQKVIGFDNTDYRLEEPLDKNYPFISEAKGYRGLSMFALGQPNYQAYPYRQSVLDFSSELSKEFNFVYSRIGDYETKRLFFGAIGGIHVSAQNYVLESQIAEQDNTRFYVGPYLSYDIYEQKDYYLTLNTSFLFLLYDEMQIRILDTNTGDSETRTYQSRFGIQPNVGGSINLREYFYDFDLVIGFNIRGMLPKTYKALSTGNKSGFWRKNNIDDSYDQSFRAELSYLIGLQSVY